MNERTKYSMFTVAVVGFVIGISYWSFQRGLVAGEQKICVETSMALSGKQPTAAAEGPCPKQFPSYARATCLAQEESRMFGGVTDTGVLLARLEQRQQEFANALAAEERLSESVARKRAFAGQLQNAIRNRLPPEELQKLLLKAADESAR